MFGKHLWLVAIEQYAQAFQVFGIERLFAANRQAYPMDRERVLLADQVQVVVERASGDHVVLCMYLKEPDVRPGIEYIPEMLGLEPQPRTWRKLGRARRDERSRQAVHHQHSATRIRIWQ